MDPGRPALKGRGARLFPVLLFLVVPSLAGQAEDRPAPAVSRVQGRTLSFPNDVALDRRGFVFVLDSGSHSILLLSAQGEFIREIRGKGTWKDPMAIALGPDGSLFLADGAGGRVLEIELSGRVRREYPVGRNARVTGVGVFGDSIYCVDNRNDAVVVFRRGGGRSGEWGRKGDGAGEFNAPFRIAVDGGGRVFVTDVLNARVQWFSAFGQHLGTIRRFGAGQGKIFRPTSIAIDRLGRVWIGDSYTGLVQLFDPGGNLVRVVGKGGRPHVFGDPIGLAEGPEGIWVVDQSAERVALFRR